MTKPDVLNDREWHWGSELMECDSCGGLFSVEPRRAVFTILDRYFLEIRYPDGADQSRERLNPLFSNLLEDIRSGQNIDDFRNFEYYIHDYDMGFACPECGFRNSRDYILWIPDAFFCFIEDYIEFEIDNLLLKHIGATSAEVGVDTLDQGQLRAFLDELPDQYARTRDLILRLDSVKQVLPILGGRGGGIEIIEAIVDSLSAEIVGALVSLSVASGVRATRDLLKSVSIRKRIKAKIRNESSHWDDISFDALARYLEAPSDYAGSKEELIEKILELKLKSYKGVLVEKLRGRE